MYGFCKNDGVDFVDRFGLDTAYTTGTDAKGVNFVKINKCNVLVFEGHGFADTKLDGTPVVWSQLTPAQLNDSGVPARVQNEPYSSAEVYGCNTGWYVKVQTETPGAVDPKTEVPINSDIPELWERARKQAKVICAKSGCNCKSVTITFELRENRLERPAGWFLSDTHTEVVKCQ